MKKGLKFVGWWLAIVLFVATAITAGSFGGAMFSKWALLSEAEAVMTEKHLHQANVEPNEVATAPAANEEEIEFVVEDLDPAVAVSDSKTADSEEKSTQTEKQENSAAKPMHVVLGRLYTETPMVAIVIDDMGVNQRRTKDMLKLKGAFTSSFLTYGHDLRGLVASAREAGHEVMLHAAMEPKVPANLAPDTMKTKMSEAEIEALFQGMLNKFDGMSIQGVNNHMGSRFTEDREKLGYVMAIIKKHNMYYLDSKTTARSAGPALAMEYGVPFAERDEFLDNKDDYDYVMRHLARIEAIAKEKGFAVAICHPKAQTYKALNDWLQQLPGKKIKLVHLQDIISTINR